MFSQDATELNVKELNAKADALDASLGMDKLQCRYCTDTRMCEDAWMIDPREPCCMFTPAKGTSH